MTPIQYLSTTPTTIDVTAPDSIIATNPDIVAVSSSKGKELVTVNLTSFIVNAYNAIAYPKCSENDIQISS